jgi:polyisoprenoid-binding protein YceI
MRTALMAAQHSDITWRMSSYRVDGDSVEMTGLLTIAGEQKPLQLRARGQATDGSIRVQGSTRLRMTEFGVKPPTLMLGTMRVHDAVTVKFDVALNP